MAFNLTQDQINELESSGFRNVRSWAECRDYYRNDAGRFGFAGGVIDVEATLKNNPNGVLATLDLTVFFKTGIAPLNEWRHTHKGMEVLILHVDSIFYRGVAYNFINEILSTNHHDHARPKYVNSNFGWDQENCPRFCISGARAAAILRLGAENKWPEAFNTFRATCAPIHVKYKGYYGVSRVEVCSICESPFHLDVSKHPNYSKCCVCRRFVCPNHSHLGAVRAAALKNRFSGRKLAKISKRVGPLCNDCLKAL